MTRTLEDLVAELKVAREEVARSESLVRQAETQLLQAYRKLSSVKKALAAALDVDDLE